MQIFAVKFIFCGELVGFYSQFISHMLEITRLAAVAKIIADKVYLVVNDSVHH